MATKRQASRYPHVRRNQMRNKVQPIIDLDLTTPYDRLSQAHAVARRAFVDWKDVAGQSPKQAFHRESSVTVNSLGEVVIVVDDGSLTLRSGELDYIAVWDQVRKAYGDAFDFLTFFTDFSVPFSYSFWSAIYFSTQGISPYLPYDGRAEWSSNRLQGFHFINPAHINLMGVYLQEFGHQWGSYVYYADSPDSPFVETDLLLDGEPGHWDFHMDDAHSPMDYDFLFTPYMSTHWEPRDDDEFEYHATEGIEYCDLDLYLMGLLAPDDARPFYFIDNPQQIGPQVWSGQRSEVTVDMVVNAMGARQDPPGLRTNDFRDAWVMVTRNAKRGATMASRLDAIRQDFELRYHVATRCLGRVDTTLP